MTRQNFAWYPLAVAAIAVGTLAATTQGLAGTAAASPPTNAADVVKNLQDHGYIVQLNVTTNGVRCRSARSPLSTCPTCPVLV